MKTRKKIDFAYGSCFSIKLDFLFGGAVTFEVVKGYGGNYRRTILIEHISDAQIPIDIFFKKQWAKATYEMEDQHVRDLKLFGTVPFLGFPEFITVWVLEREMRDNERIVYVGSIDINSDDPICRHDLSSFDAFLGAPMIDARGLIDSTTVHRNQVLGNNNWNGYGDMSLAEIEMLEKEASVCAPQAIKFPNEPDLRHPLLKSIWTKKK